MNGWRDLERSGVLVLDDEEGIRETVRRYLEGEGYRVYTAGCVEEARAQLDSHDILVVLADIVLPGGENGLDLLAEVRREHAGVEVIMMTANSDAASAVEALKHGAYDYLCKPFPFEQLQAALSRAVEHRRLAVKVAMLERMEERRATDEENLEAFFRSMVNTIDARSRFTLHHSRRVSELSAILARALGLEAGHVRLVARGGYLHDIGKIGTPDSILHKEGPLTRDEFEVMKQHPAAGDDLIAPIPSMRDYRPMIRWHHERLDGLGYPDGLPGDQVPQEAWIVKVADMWEAITSWRPYREPMALDVAVNVLRAEAGERIPADIVATFLKAIQDAPIALPATTPA